MTTEITNILKGFKEFSETPYEDSIKFLTEYIEVEPSQEAFFELGKALFFNEDYDESIEYLEKCSCPKANAYLGLDYYRKEDFKRAIDYFKEFLKDIKNETILNYLMISYEKENDLADAILTGDDILEINPKNTSVILRLVDYHFTLKQYERSLDCIRLYENTKDFYEPYDEKLKFRKAEVLFHLKRYEDAIRLLRKLKTVESYHLISRSYERLGKPSKAVRYLMKSYELDRNVETLFEISDFHFRNDSYVSAVNILRDILDINPNDERALERIARAYMKNHDRHFAVEYAERLLEVNERNITSYVVLSNMEYIFGDLDKAMEYIDRGLEMNSESAELWFDKAWVHDPRDFEQFKKSLERGLHLEPNNVKNHLRLIDECLWEDEKDNAERYYEKMLFYNPTFSKSFDEILNEYRSMRL